MLHPSPLCFLLLCCCVVVLLCCCRWCWCWTALFIVLTRRYSQLTINYQLKSGAEAKDYSAVAKKEHLQPMELELRRLEDQVAMISESLTYLKSREEEMRYTNGTISAHG